MDTLEHGISPEEAGIKSGTEAGMSKASLPGSPANDAGISFREAALRLSISEKTLRARIRSGEVHGWTVEGKRGLEWRVHLPVVQDGDREPAPEARDHSRDKGRDEGNEARDRYRDGDRDHDGEDRDRDRELAAVSAERDRLADEVTWLRGRVEEAAQEAREMRILFARALPQPEQPKALEANITPASCQTPAPKKRRWFLPWTWRLK